MTKIIPPANSFLNALTTCSFDRETGAVYARNGRRLDEAKSDGYHTVHYLGRDLPAHHVVWFLSTGNWPKDIIDHIDRNRSNNSPSNLREVNAEQNQRNKGQRGYYYDKDKQKWRVQWSYNNRQVYVGLYSSENFAAQVYQAATAGFGILSEGE